MLFRRRALDVARARMLESPVLLVEGPRTVGKSTLLRDLAASFGTDVVDLDVPAVRDAVAADPSLFASAAKPVLLDEYQKAPIVLDAIKAELNRDAVPGQFALAGSTRHDSLPPAAQALTGRLTTVRLLPLSQGETAGVTETWLERVFEDPEAVVAVPPAAVSSREDYLRRIVVGGLPLAIAQRSEAARNRWFDDYVSLTLARDVRDLSRVRQQARLPALLARLAGQTAQLVNAEAVARDIGIDPKTAESWTWLLEAVFLVHRLPAWGRSLTARAVGTPKIHVLDSGVASRLLGLSAARLGRRDVTALQALGHVLESFVVGELMKQSSWLDDVRVSGHWRTRDGDEVDVVLEHDDGRVVAVEVKAGSRVPGEDLRPLRKLRDALGDQFWAGVVLHLGERSYTSEDRLHVMPVDRLWHPAPDAERAGHG